MPSPEPLPADVRIGNIEAECHMRMTKIRQVARMKDVAQLKEVRLDEELRARAPEIRGIGQLQLAAEMRMREILDGHMHELRAQRDVQMLQQARSYFLHREWSHLKGVYPLIYREAEVESEKILGRLERELDVRRKRSR